jgi:MATE family multidrug resistance protein
MDKAFTRMIFSRDEASRIVRLAVPVFFAQLSQMLMSVVDTIMTGHYRTTDMAAVAVAASLWVPVSLFGIGIMLALTPLIAQRLGAG